MSTEPGLTVLLQEWRNGDPTALDRLAPYVYDELRRVARRHMRSENAQHTLQATALVNEAFLRVAGAKIDYKDRAHFFRTAAQMMRRILVDHARAKHRDKRGGRARDLTYDEAAMVTEDALPAILELDAALDKLAGSEPNLALIVELLYFGGLTYKEAADQVGVSRTVFAEDLQFAKAWLRNELS